MMWKERGISFPDLITKLIDLSIERHKRSEGIKNEISNRTWNTDGKSKRFLSRQHAWRYAQHLSVTIGTLACITIGYFYIYLPNATNHGDAVTVPDLTGLPPHKLDSAVTAANLRFEVGDSAYSDDFKPLDVIRQFPHAGSVVKPGRKIFVSINRINPPTVPLPALDNGDVSLIKCRSYLQSNELKVGRIFYRQVHSKILYWKCG